MKAYTPFTIRTTKPCETDELIKCYQRQKSDLNGWNGCILGSPTDPVANVLHNCTGHSQGRFCESYDEVTGYRGINKWFYLNCSAGAFLERAKKTYPDLELGGPNDDPRPGAIMVWAGHVAFIEKLIDDNTVFTSESAYNGQAFFNLTRTRANNWSYDKQFLGFIYNPAIVELSVTEGFDERDETKNQIHALNNKLRVRSLPSLKADKVGHVTAGKYYIQNSTYEADGYTWYEIAPYNWIAGTDDIEILPKVEPKTTEEEKTEGIFKMIQALINFFKQIFCKEDSEE